MNSHNNNNNQNQPSTQTNDTDNANNNSNRFGRGFRNTNRLHEILPNMELEIHGCRVQNKVEYTVRFINGVKCYNCHKLGYFTRDCPTVQRKQYTKKQTSNDEDEDEQGEQGRALSLIKD